MTRLYGYSQEEFQDDEAREGLEKLVNNIGLAIQLAYENGWQCAGVAFISVNSDNQVQGSEIYKGYRGVTPTSDIYSLIPDDIILTPQKSVFTQVMTFPDVSVGGQDEQTFNKWEKSKFPLESKNWLVLTSGYWDKQLHNDSTTSWYDPIHPEISVIKYLESLASYQIPDFSWIDSSRLATVIAVNKVTGKPIIYTAYQKPGKSFVIEKVGNSVVIDGFRDLQGNLI